MQVVEGEKSVMDFASYVPIGNSPEKLMSWFKQGAEIRYLSSHKKHEDFQKDKIVLAKYDFTEGEVYFRTGDEGYKDIVERILPDILLEDDCESIGGVQEMVYPHLKPELMNRIKSIVVKEFDGIDHLPDEIGDLINY